MNEEEVLHVPRLRDLGTAEPAPIGTRIAVAEEGHIYTSIGTIHVRISERIGFLHASNVWMPDHVVTYVTEKRGNVFPDPVRAAAALIAAPASVHLDVRKAGCLYFFGSGDMLRTNGLLSSSTTQYVDAAIELRQVAGGSLLRLFHLSPRSRNQGGAQLWP